MRRQVAILGKGLRMFTGKYSPQRRGEADKSSTVLLNRQGGMQLEMEQKWDAGLIGKLKQGLIMRQQWSSFMHICVYVVVMC
jgi:hypothetical protein